MEERQKNTGYIPGNCNIGTAEIARRYRIGYLGSACTFITIFCIQILDADKMWRLVVFFPVALAMIGFLQAMHKFCLNYGYRGVFSVTGLRDLKQVTNAEDLRKDRKMAMTLVVKVILVAILCSLLYFLLP